MPKPNKIVGIALDMDGCLYRKRPDPDIADQWLPILTAIRQGAHEIINYFEQQGIINNNTQAIHLYLGSARQTLDSDQYNNKKYHHFDTNPPNCFQAMQLVQEIFQHHFSPKKQVYLQPLLLPDIIFTNKKVGHYFNQYIKNKNPRSDAIYADKDKKLLIHAQLHHFAQQTVPRNHAYKPHCPQASFYLVDDRFNIITHNRRFFLESCYIPHCVGMNYVIYNNEVAPTLLYNSLLTGTGNIDVNFEMTRQLHTDILLRRIPSTENDAQQREEEKTIQSLCQQQLNQSNKQVTQSQKRACRDIMDLMDQFIKFGYDRDDLEQRLDRLRNDANVPGQPSYLWCRFFCCNPGPKTGLAFHVNRLYNHLYNLDLNFEEDYYGIDGLSQPLNGTPPGQIN